ncbi:DnaJ domain-containing protein [Eggerthellaceae bacterium zg-893]|nr:DnaJ domain-containing protein [Eggerthellaceae bacterium zg-893]
MAMDPYKVLGVSPDATPDEVKKAYRKKARENHPDLNPNDPGAVARMNEVNEAYDRIVNPEKYVTRDARAAAARGSGAAGGGASGGGQAYRPSGGGAGPGGQNPYGQPGGQNPYGTSGPYGWTGYGFDWDDLFGFGATGPASGAPIHPEAGAGDSAVVRGVIDDINAQRYQQAVDTLNTITSHGRDARWYYLSAIANNGAGNTLMALEQIRRAVRMDPSNPDYQRVQRSFQQASHTYEQQTEERGFSMGIDPATLCCAIWCCGPSLCGPVGFCL